MRVLLALWLLALGGSGCDGESEAVEPTDRAAVRIESAVVATGTLRETVRGIGTVRAAETIEVRAEVSGLVSEVHYDEGSRVGQGELLYTLDDGKLRSELASREAGLRRARAAVQRSEQRFERVRALYDREAVATEEYDRARTDLRGARAAEAQAQAQAEVVREQLRDTLIYAPFEGPISESQVDPGDFVQVGERLATLYRTSPLEVDFRLPERFAGRVERGQPVEVEAAAFPGRTFHGRVEFVGPAVDERTRDFLVKGTIENPGGVLKPGSFATAVVVVEEHAGRPVVPEEALVATRTGYLVFVVENGTAHARPVTLGLRDPGQAEIVLGLEAGETIVRNGHQRLSDGVPVAEVIR